MVLDDTTGDQPSPRHIARVTRPWSGTPRKVVRGLNLIPQVGTDSDRNISCADRTSSKADGRTTKEPCGERLLRAKGRGCSPQGVRCDSGSARLENRTPVRGFGGKWRTRLKGNRNVTRADGRTRPRDEGAIAAGGPVRHRTGSGPVRVVRCDAPDGDTAFWATHDLGRDGRTRRSDAELSFGIANDHRAPK